LGKRKAKFLPIRYSAEEIESIKAVKRRLHPNASLGRGTFSCNRNAPRLPFFLLTSARTQVPESPSRHLGKEPALQRGQSGVSQIA